MNIRLVVIAPDIELINPDNMLDYLACCAAEQDIPAQGVSFELSDKGLAGELDGPGVGQWFFVAFELNTQPTIPSLLSGVHVVTLGRTGDLPPLPLMFELHQQALNGELSLIDSVMHEGFTVNDELDVQGFTYQVEGLSTEPGAFIEFIAQGADELINLDVPITPTTLH